MGIFDFFKRKNGNEQDNGAEDKVFTKDLTYTIAISMQNMKITKQPVLRFFDNDRGIREGFILSHLNDPDFKALKLRDKDLYLMMLSLRAFGAGAYITICQDKYQKSVENFTVEEVEEIRRAFRLTDPYELTLQTMGIDPNSGNKACLDQISKIAVKTSKDLLDEKAYDDGGIKSLMSVMFNAGITLVMR